MSVPALELPWLPTADDLPCDDDAAAAQMPALSPLPTDDDLPYEDGVPLESPRHYAQLNLLYEALLPWAVTRGDVAVGGNQFVYFNGAQVRGRYFRGPDLFVVTGVPRRERKSWVVWQEGKGPDVVIELLSASTARFDKGAKRLVYQNQLRVPAYFWFDPFHPEDRAGFVLRDNRYESLAPDADGGLPVAVLGLRLVLWEGAHEDITGTWLRWADEDGLLPLPVESATRRAEAERQRADRAEQELARLRALLAASGDPPRG